MTKRIDLVGSNNIETVQRLNKKVKDIQRLMETFLSEMHVKCCLLGPQSLVLVSIVNH